MNPFDGKPTPVSSPFDLPLKPKGRSDTSARSIFLLIAVVKQRMQLQNSSYATVSQAFRSVYKTEGISAFYVSYPTTLVMTIPFTAVQFTCYEFL